MSVEKFVKKTENILDNVSDDFNHPRRKFSPVLPYDERKTLGAFATKDITEGEGILLIMVGVSSLILALWLSWFTAVSISPSTILGILGAVGVIFWVFALTLFVPICVFVQVMDNICAKRERLTKSTYERAVKITKSQFEQWVGNRYGLTHIDVSENVEDFNLFLVSPKPEVPVKFKANGELFVLGAEGSLMYVMKPGSDQELDFVWSKRVTVTSGKVEVKSDVSSDVFSKRVFKKMPADLKALFKLFEKKVNILNGETLNTEDAYVVKKAEETVEVVLASLVRLERLESFEDPADWVETGSVLNELNDKLDGIISELADETRNVIRCENRVLLSD